MESAKDKKLNPIIATQKKPNIKNQKNQIFNFSNPTVHNLQRAFDMAAKFESIRRNWVKKKSRY